MCKKSFRVCGWVGSLVWVPCRNGENFAGSDLTAHPPAPELFFRENPILQRPEASGKQEILGNNRARIITKSTFKAGPLPPVGKGFSKAECIWLPSE